MKGLTAAYLPDDLARQKNYEEQPRSLSELKEYLNEWERVYSAYIEEYEHASSPAEARLLTESYNKWKYSFPPTQSEAESKLSRKQILEQQLQLLDEQREILQRKIEELENETED